MSVDPTREAVAAAVLNTATMMLTTSTMVSKPTEEDRVIAAAIADDVLAVVYSQDWLTALVRRFSILTADPEYMMDAATNELLLAAVPPSLRAAAGIETT